jgi:hypothetical protein
VLLRRQLLDQRDKRREMLILGRLALVARRLRTAQGSTDSLTGEVQFTRDATD